MLREKRREKVKIIHSPPELLYGDMRGISLFFVLLFKLAGFIQTPSAPYQLKENGSLVS